MKEKKGRQKIVYSVMAVAIFALLLLAFLGKESSQSADDVDIVIFGDSIMGEYREETSVTKLMEEILGEKVFNGGLGGTCYSYTESPKRLAYTKDVLNMVSLSLAIYADDFRPQLTTRIRENATDYFKSTVEGISSLEYENMEVVFLAHGMNDYHAAIPFDNSENEYDPYTFKGAIRSTVKNIKEAYPNLRIILVTPTYSWYTSTGLTCENYDTGNGYLEGYVKAELELAEELDLEIIDLYHDFYTHDVYEDWQLYTNDGLHPNETGRRMIAEKLAGYLLENP